MFAKLFAKLTGADVGSVVNFFKQRQQLKQQAAIQKVKLKNDLKIAKLNGKIAQQTARDNYRAKKLQDDSDWAIAQLQSKGNWLRADYVIAVLSIPAILCFIDATITANGFDALKHTPWYYQMMMGTAFMAPFGVKFTNLIKQHVLPRLLPKPKLEDEPKPEDQPVMAAPQ